MNISLDKLSLAIGRRGQNVRLAAQITGWKLDVLSETKFQERELESIESLALISGIDDGLARKLQAIVWKTVKGTKGE